MLLTMTGKQRQWCLFGTVIQSHLALQFDRSNVVELSVRWHGQDFLYIAESGDLRGCPVQSSSEKRVREGTSSIRPARRSDPCL